MKDFVNPFPWSGEDTGDGSFSSNEFVFENYSVGPDSKAVESFQFVAKGFEIPILVGEILNREPDGMAWLGRKAFQIIKNLFLHSDGDHIASRAEMSW